MMTFGVPEPTDPLEVPDAYDPDPDDYSAPPPPAPGVGWFLVLFVVAAGVGVLIEFVRLLRAAAAARDGFLNL